MWLARRITALDNELAENIAATTALLAQSPVKTLFEKIGIGPVTAAVAMAAWSHDGRVRDEPAFASLAGVNPSLHRQATQCAIACTEVETGD